jgi:hypothetical protein
MAMDTMRRSQWATNNSLMGMHNNLMDSRMDTSSSRDGMIRLWGHVWQRWLVAVVWMLVYCFRGEYGGDINHRSEELIDRKIAWKGEW